ncbi:DGQHR domain-containing protein [Bacillus sp. FJAT-49711]|uniref:DGQHR domain-containing protein n=1 Tax=Bacillus sp. FJAT-49711 TaxID=2833585 RepID=UPI001BC9B26C|nr:DGQHR domain-containing protein [Bacillus sp. FJAT-49711]MBS4218324.1 DGQHR domain-containing protein [Bacillus sp. FJAT-49711]
MATKLKSKIKDANKYSLATILVTQGKYRYYIASMPSEYLKDTCFTVTRDEDPLEGFQRRLDENRAKEIAEYIDVENGSIPTAIILSAQEEAQLEHNTRSKTISFSKKGKSFLVIDGQHRVWGFMKAISSVRVPVVIFEGLSRIEEAQLFIDINTTQQKVPDALLLDVKRLLQNETEDEKRCSDLFEQFFTTKGSILKGHLVRAETQSGKISRKLFNSSVKEVLNNRLGEVDIDKSYIAINNYLRAFNEVFKEIDEGLKNHIYRPVVFQGILNISSNVIGKTIEKHNKLTYDAFYDIIKPLKTNISKSKLQRPGGSYRKFSEQVYEALTRVHVQANIIVEE